MPITLSFYDHHRQSYAQTVPLREGVGEFMIGDYGANSGSVGAGGEFAIALHAFNRRNGGLSPQLRVFTDATGSLTRFLALGAWDRITEAAVANRIKTRDDLTALLIGCGLRDYSHHAVELAPCPPA